MIKLTATMGWILEMIVVTPTIMMMLNDDGDRDEGDEDDGNDLD